MFGETTSSFDPNTGRTIGVSNVETGEVEQVLVRWVNFATVEEVHKEFVHAHGETCRMIGRRRGKTKRLVPGVEYMKKLKPRHVKYQHGDRP